MNQFSSIWQLKNKQNPVRNLKTAAAREGQQPFLLLQLFHYDVFENGKIHYINCSASVDIVFSQ